MGTKEDGRAKTEQVIGRTYDVVYSTYSSRYIPVYVVSKQWQFAVGIGLAAAPPTTNLNDRLHAQQWSSTTRNRSATRRNSSTYAPPPSLSRSVTEAFDVETTHDHDSQQSTPSPRTAIFANADSLLLAVSLFPSTASLRRNMGVGTAGLAGGRGRL